MVIMKYEHCFLFFSFQAIFLTRRCPQQGPYPGYRASSVMPTTRAFAILPLERVLRWWETSMTPCESPFCTRIIKLFYQYIFYSEVYLFTSFSLLEMCYRVSDCASLSPESPVCSLMPRSSCCTRKMIRATRATRDW